VLRCAFAFPTTPIPAETFLALPADYLQVSILDILRTATMLDDINCTQDELDQGIVCLSRGQSIGLSVDAEAGLLSLTAVVGVFVLIFVSHNVWRRWTALTILLCRSKSIAAEDWSNVQWTYLWCAPKIFVETRTILTIQCEQLALFVFDMVMALGRITNIKWVQDGKIFEGSFCTAQGKNNWS